MACLTHLKQTSKFVKMCIYNEYRLQKNHQGSILRKSILRQLIQGSLFFKEVNLSLVKLPLNFNGILAKIGLTSLVKFATGAILLGETN